MQCTFKLRYILLNHLYEGTSLTCKYHRVVLKIFLFFLLRTVQNTKFHCVALAVCSFYGDTFHSSPLPPPNSLPVMWHHRIAIFVVYNASVTFEVFDFDYCGSNLVEYTEIRDVGCPRAGMGNHITSKVHGILVDWCLTTHQPLIMVNNA